MNTLPKLELVSFRLCPYVQRAVITLKQKKVPFSVKEIDLYNPPEWFEKISPAGRVPVLIVDEKTPLFESAVINDYLDEITEPKLNPKDPLLKAKERAWIEFGSELMSVFYGVYTTDDRAAFDASVKEFFETLSKLEPEAKGPFFRGGEFSLVDTSYAPLFLRLSFIPMLWNHEAWKSMPKVRAWAETLIRHPAVLESCPSDLKEGIVVYVKKSGPFLMKESQ
ncbi:MAG: glutathione S-transferase family protein [Proteobacteria bacterium]|nr:glutathione S-transferase family protein [Pseudomonadota bacterium]